MPTRQWSPRYLLVARRTCPGVHDIGCRFGLIFPPTEPPLDSVMQHSGPVSMQTCHLLTFPTSSGKACEEHATTYTTRTDLIWTYCSPHCRTTSTHFQPTGTGSSTDPSTLPPVHNTPQWPPTGRMPTTPRSQARALPISTTPSPLAK